VVRLICIAIRTPLSNKKKEGKYMKKFQKPTILIDLDGVLNKYCCGYNENTLPEITENAINF
jgi:hypothetical protein